MLRQVRFPKVKRTSIPSLDLINPTILILIKLQLLTFMFSSWFLKSYLFQKKGIFCIVKARNKIKLKKKKNKFHSCHLGWNSFIPPLSIVGGFSWAWQWRNLGSEVGNINPEYKDPPFSNPFVILAL